MKNISVAVAVTALIAFSLGYFARGAVERTVRPSTNAEKSLAREHTESPATQAQTIVGAEQNDAKAPLIASADKAVVVKGDRSSSRIQYMKIRLGDFFLINNIGPEREEQIIQGLIDADHYLALKRKSMIDRQLADRAEPIAQEDIDKASLTSEENAELERERESLYRQITDEHYGAFQEYNRTSRQREAVGAFSSSLQEPMEHAAKESLVQIMYEESSKLESELKSKSTESGAHLTSTPQGWEALEKRSRERRLGMTSYNERVLDRAKTYLTPLQFEQLKRRLDNDLRRFELLIELAAIDEDY